MNYVKKWAFALLIISFSIIESLKGITPQGPLGRVGKTAIEAVNSFGTATNKNMQDMIQLYAPYASMESKEKKTLQEEVEKGTFNTVLQDHGMLMEGFFAQVALLMDSSVAPKVDQTSMQSVNPNLVLQSGIAPTTNTKSSFNKMVKLPLFCGDMFNISRYIRGIGSPLSGPKVIPTEAIDSFYGVVLINIGWLGSVEETGLWESNPDVIHKNNIYWIKSGINITSLEKNQTFIVPQASGVARVEGGIDSWSSSGNSRSLSFILSDKNGVAAFSSETQPYKITISKGHNPNAPIIKVIDTSGVADIVSVTSQMQTFFKKSASLPWAFLAESSNGSTGGKANLKPTIKIRGLIRLNPNEFPLHYQAKGASFVEKPFTSAVLSEGVRAFEQQIAFLPTYSKSSVIQNVGLGDCKDMSLQLKFTTSDPLGMYVQPINFGLAKYKGALGYAWGSKFSFQEALNGTINVLENLFIKNSDLSAANLLAQIEGKKRIGDKIIAVQANPSITVI